MAIGVTKVIYHVHILKRTHANGIAKTIEKRMHTASSDDEAIRTAKENLHFSAPPTASWFLAEEAGRQGDLQVVQDGDEKCQQA